MDRIWCSWVMLGATWRNPSETLVPLLPPTSREQPVTLCYPLLRYAALYFASLDDSQVHVKCREPM